MTKFRSRTKIVERTVVELGRGVRPRVLPLEHGLVDQLVDSIDHVRSLLHDRILVPEQYQASFSENSEEIQHCEI